MPTYEYACQSCGTHVEVYQKFSDEPLTECGVCGGPLRKVFHPAGILFKGSGFYATDSRASRAKAGAGDGGQKGEGGSKESSKAASSPGSGSSGTSERASKTSSSKTESPSSSAKERSA